MDLIISALLALLATLSPVGPGTTVTEDSPGWNCATDGNAVCGIVRVVNGHMFRGTLHGYPVGH